MTVEIKRRVTPEVQQSFDCLPLLERVYSARGITSSAELSLKISGLQHYQSLKNISPAAEAIAQAIVDGKRIMIIGDFDADGATSTALCMLALKAFGAKSCQYLVPNRFDFGYGLSPEIVDVAAQENTEFIITVDNGISSVAGVERAQYHNIDVVITDHHLAGKTLPNALAIVNPNQLGCQFPSKNLAGVGVAFYVLLAVRYQLQQQGWFEKQQIPVPNLADYLDIVALGTVADVVKLDHNNRILVHQGLQRIRSGKCRPGILALLSVAKREKSRLQASDLGFVLGPRLNAAGRLDDISLGIECLLLDDTDRVREIAADLNDLNIQRREIEAGMQQQAEKAIHQLDVNIDDQIGLTLYQKDWHQGVIGIVAGRIKEQFYRPTIAFAHQDEKVIKGSARSIPGVHIRDILEQVNSQFPGVIDKFGGHAMAAGLSMPVEQFAAFNSAFQTVLANSVDQAILSPVIETDGPLDACDFDLSVAQQLRSGGPWGQGFPEPVFDGEMILLSQRIVGEKHLKVSLANEFGEKLEGIMFNISPEQWPLAGTPKVHVVYSLDINEFRQQQNLQLMIKTMNLLAV